jgi:hypothetical protein
LAVESELIVNDMALDSALTSCDSIPLVELNIANLVTIANPPKDSARKP